MPEYKAIDPNVETIGAAISSAMEGLGDKATPILKKHNLYPIDPEAWYPQQDWLNVIGELSEKNFMNLVAVGMKIPDNAAWPPDVKTVHDALASINIAYGMNNRGGEFGDYHYEQTGETSGVMVCDNPFPSDFDYGIIYRTVQKFAQDATNMVVEVDPEKPTRKKGGESCTYLIEW